MIITKSRLKEIIKEELLKEMEEVEMSDLYADYGEDPIEALEKKREELKSKMRKRATAKDAEDFKKLNKEIVRLKKLKQEKQ